MGSRNQLLRIGEWLVEPELNRISREAGEINLRPQAMDLLVFLAHRQNRVVSSDTLIDHVWDGVIVSSGSVYNCISELRQAFDDTTHPFHYIETISKRGYRLIAPVTFSDSVNSENSNDKQERGVLDEAIKNVSASRWRLLSMSLLFALLFLSLIYKFILNPDDETTSLPEIPIRSIAVLPFKDMSPAGDQEYFTDGITEVLLNKLAAAKGLKVAARTSSFYFKDNRPSIIEIGQTLGVAHILEGSLQRTGNRIRITAQLIGVSDGYHLWSHTYDRELDDIFKIQDEISAAIVEALIHKLGLAEGEIQVHQKAGRPANTEAYIANLLGSYIINQRRADKFQEAIEHFNKAISFDEGYALPYANIAMTYGLLHGYTELSRQEALARAKPFAERAMALDPNLAQANAAMYYIEDLEKIHDPDLTYLNRAIALNPSFMNARIWKMNNLVRWHRYKEMIAFGEANETIDPLSIIHSYNFARSLYDVGQKDRAQIIVERLKNISPGFGQRLAVDLAYQEGDIRGAVMVLLEGMKAMPNGYQIVANPLGVILYEISLKEEAERLMSYTPLMYNMNRAGGNWIGALGIAREGMEKDKNSIMYGPMFAEALYLTGDYEAAVRHYDQILPMDETLGYAPLYMSETGYVFYASALRSLGDETKAGIIFSQALKALRGREEAGYNSGSFFQLKGLMLMYQGQVGDALDALEIAFDTGNRADWAFAAGFLDPVRNHPRFIALQHKYEATKLENKVKVIALMCNFDVEKIQWAPLPATCQ